MLATSKDGGGEEAVPVIEDEESPTIDYFEFDFPTDCCGMLIGYKGKNIKRYMDSSGAEISVKKKVFNQALQIVCVKGKPGFGPKDIIFQISVLKTIQ